MKKVSYLLGGIVIGMVLTVATPTLAETVKTISAKLNTTVKVAINGKSTKLNAQPITYNGLNYLPVGEISRALGMKVNYDKGTDTISINDSSAVSTNETSAQPIPTTNPTKKDVANMEVVPKVKLGETITSSDVIAVIEKIQYVSQGEVVNGKEMDKGIMIYTTVTNNSDDSFLSPGLSYQFVADNKEDEQVINNSGITAISFKRIGGDNYNGIPLSKGEGVTGYVFVKYNKDISIKEVSYYPNFARSRYRLWYL